MAESSAMELILTEVTNMRSEVCVAGWRATASRMVRPLSGPHHHWAQSLATPELLTVGNVVTITPHRNPSSGRRLPHAREDCVVVTCPALVNRIEPNALIEALRPSESPSVRALFGGHLVEGHFVIEGSDCPSLGAIQIDPRRMEFCERPREGKPPQLRCWFYDSENARYNLPVVSRTLQSIFASDGLNSVEGLRATATQGHMRIGLAHPFDDGRAYAMVNHVLFG